MESLGVDLVIATAIGETIDQCAQEMRVITGTDRGFGTFAGFGAVDPEICWAKFPAMAEGQTWRRGASAAPLPDP